MFGRWWKAGTQLAKLLIVRLVFILSLIILLPLAVLNRQSVGIFINPMDLIRAEPSGRLFMPLFIALFVIFILGLMVGWVMGRFGGAKTPTPGGVTLSDAPSLTSSHTMPRGKGMVKTAQKNPQGDKVGLRAAPQTALGAPSEEAAAPSSETSPETESDENHER